MCIIQNNLTDLRNHVNNKISHARKSKVISCGKIMSNKNATACGNSSGNSMTRLVEIFIPATNIGILHT